MKTELAKPERLERKPEQDQQFFVQPRFETIPGESAHEMRVWMPGVSKERVEISLVEDQLVIVGRREDQVPERWRPVFRELNEHDYRLRLRLNLKVDQEKISAHVEDGLLTLALPLTGDAKPRTIKIS